MDQTADQHNMTGRTCLITGSSSGIGEATAAALARMDAHVVVAGPTRDEAVAAADRIRKTSGNVRVDFVFGDLSSQTEVRRIAAEVRDRFPDLQILMNNAGIMSNTRRMSIDGSELTWATNYLSAYLLTNLLLDTLQANAPARIINVTSVAHRRGSLDFDDIGFERGYNVLRAYRRSKLALLLFTLELARRHPAELVTANALHPGVVLTGIGKAEGVLARAIQWLYYMWGRRNMVQPEDGAATGIYLASSPDVAGITGKYFVDKKIAQPSPKALDQNLAARLWSESAKMTGVPVPSS